MLDMAWMLTASALVDESLESFTKSNEQFINLKNGFENKMQNSPP